MALREPIASVLQKKDICVKVLVEPLGVWQSVPNVSSISVKEQDGGALQGLGL